MKTGQTPKIVERSTLPPELQKKNSFLSVASNMIYQTDLDDVKLQPKIGKVLKLSEVGNYKYGEEEKEGEVWNNALDNVENSKKLGDKRYLNSQRSKNPAPKIETVLRKDSSESVDSIDVGTPRDPAIALRSDIEEEDEDQDQNGSFVIDDEEDEFAEPVEVPFAEDEVEDGEVEAIEDVQAEQVSESEEEAKEVEISREDGVKKDGEVEVVIGDGEGEGEKDGGVETNFESEVKVEFDQ